MTAAVYRSGTPSLSVPPTQNTAPVLEFNCLYTHDVRKKAKKWQDGFLRYHTFNKRIMVYDVPRNLVGDVHWKLPEPVQDGDEVWLDRDIVLVQVGENVGSAQTDLTDLRNAAKRSTREKGQVSTPAPTPQRLASTATGKSQPAREHRPLNGILGKSHNLMGRATLPAKSPYETRHVSKDDRGRDGERPAKKQRIDTTEIRPHQPQTSRKAAAPLARWDAEVSDMHQQRAATDGTRSRSNDNDMIDLVGSDTAPKFMAGFSSDALEAPSSPRPRRSPNPPAPLAAQASSFPAFQPQKTGKPTTASRHALRDTAVVSQIERTVPQDSAEASTRSRFFDDRRKTKLQIATSATRKKTLLCQNQLSAPSAQSEVSVVRSVPSENVELAMEILYRTTSAKTGKASRQKTEEQLQQMSRKSDYEATPLTNKPSRAALPDQAHTVAQSVETSTTDLQELARLDEILLPSLKPVPKEGSRLGRSARALKNGIHAGRLPLQNVKAPHEPGSSIMRPGDDDATSHVEQTSHQIPPPAQIPSRADEPAQSPIEISPEKIETRPFRRMVSDPTNSLKKPTPKRIAGAPARYKTSSRTPSVSADNASDHDISRLCSPQLTSLRNLPRSHQAKSAVRAESEAAALPSNDQPSSKPKPKPFNDGARKFQRSVSLNTVTRGTAAVMLGRPFQKPGTPTAQKQKSALPPNPWSREAFDLFDWRPPGWNEEKWCESETDMGSGQGTVRGSLEV